MRHRTKLENINVTCKGLQVTFDTNFEAEEFLKECGDKSTAAEIEGNKVTLLMPAQITKTGGANSPA